MSDITCNLCGGTTFVDYKTRGRIRCQTCGSIERHRLMYLYLEKFVKFRPGLKVLHLAPERQFFKNIANEIGDTYDPRDLDVERYANLKFKDITVNRIDLCTDTPTLPSNHYDLVLHNHVLEHLPCNVTAVLFHLHRAMAPDGTHMFSIPIFKGRYEESFVDMNPEERTARFHQWDHLRNFGRDDLLSTIGMVFNIEDQLTITPISLFGEETLRRHNIPENRWRRFTGASPFILRKNDILLHANS